MMPHSDELKNARSKKMPAPLWIVIFLVSAIMIAAGMLGALQLYRYGKTRGIVEERTRAFSKEGAIVVPGQSSGPSTNNSQPALNPTNNKINGISTRIVDIRTGSTTDPIKTELKDESWCFGPDQCARIVWPMEIAEADDECDRRHFKLRQGSSRFAGPGKGVSEFVFETETSTMFGVWVRMKHTDDCGNSINVSIDDSPNTFVGNTKIYGQWLWEHSYRPFICEPGKHRITITTKEDGLVFDKVVLIPMNQAINADMFRPEALNSRSFTPPPSFTSIPSAGPNRPAIEGLSIEAYPSKSLVIGKGHRNTIRVFIRLNSDTPIQGKVKISSRMGIANPFKSFHVTPENRTVFLDWDLELQPQNGYFQPITVTVSSGDQVYERKQINMIRPLSWAFLGPFPDPEKKALENVLPPDKDIAGLKELPAFPGYHWKIVEDGSCYDEFGLVDINKLFGLHNGRYRDHGKTKVKPAIVYAVTCLSSPVEMHHNVMSFGGDDMLHVWLNGKELLKYTSNAPMETQNHIAGVEMERGNSFFTFKVPQSDYYWQILFEPHLDQPYSAREMFYGVPVKNWR